MNQYPIKEFIMPYKDLDKKRECGRKYYHKRRAEDPSYGAEKNARRDARIKEDPEYADKIRTMARERRRELSKDPEWKDRRNVQRRELYKNNHIEYLLKACRYRAKKAGLEFNIDATDVAIPNVCPILSIPIEKGTGKPSDNSPNIDRIDPHKGYIKGNVWVISHRANRIKNDASLEELELIVKALRNITY
jgi:hypothetical protein